MTSIGDRKATAWMEQNGILLKDLCFARVTVLSLAKADVYLICGSFRDGNIE